MLDIDALPNDVESLERLLTEWNATLREKRLQIEEAKLQLAKLQWDGFCASSEPLEVRLEDGSRLKEWFS